MKNFVTVCCFLLLSIIGFYQPMSQDFCGSTHSIKSSNAQLPYENNNEPQPLTNNLTPAEEEEQKCEVLFIPTTLRFTSLDPNSAFKIDWPPKHYLEQQFFNRFKKPPKA